LAERLLRSSGDREGPRLKAASFLALGGTPEQLSGKREICSAGILPAV